MKSVFSFHHVGPRDWTQIARSGGHCTSLSGVVSKVKIKADSFFRRVNSMQKILRKNGYFSSPGLPGTQVSFLCLGDEIVGTYEECGQSISDIYQG